MDMSIPDMPVPPISLPAFAPACALALGFPVAEFFCASSSAAMATEPSGWMCAKTVRSEFNFRVSGHAHVRFGIADGFAVRSFEAKAQPDKMIDGEGSGAAFPNHFVTIR